MPTIAQVINRRRPVGDRDRYYTATVTAVGPPVTVALDPGGATTKALQLPPATYTVNQRVLVVSTAFGNFILGRIA